MDIKSRINIGAIEIACPHIIPNEFLPKRVGSQGEYLLELCKDGAKRLYGCKDLENPSSQFEIMLHERLYYEFEIMNRYQLVSSIIFMKMLVNWIEKRRVFCGLTQGSLSGSLVAYLIGISAVDTLRHDLIFERWFCPDRVTIPHFEIQVCPCLKEEVIARARAIGTELCALKKLSETQTENAAKLLLLQVDGDDLIGRISITRLLVEQRHGLSVAYSHINWDDVEVLKVIVAESVSGLGKTGKHGLLTNPRLKSIDQLTALKVLALSCIEDRELRQKYIDRANEEVIITYDHPVLESVLRETFGLFLFEEQVIFAAQKLAGYSLGQGDILRRALLKNKAGVLVHFRDRFIDSCFSTNAICHEDAERIFDSLANYSSRVIGKAYTIGLLHNVCFDAWLKAYYPEEHRAATLAWLSMQS